MASLALAMLAIGAAPDSSDLVSSATAQTQAGPQLPAPPASGEMGFAIWYFAPPVIQGKDACPQGPALKNREIFLAKLPPEERERLQKPENQNEMRQRWLTDVTGPDGSKQAATWCPGRSASSPRANGPRSCCCAASTAWSTILTWK
jgi:hypothetical protein